MFLKSAFICKVQILHAHPEKTKGTILPELIGLMLPQSLCHQVQIYKWTYHVFVTRFHSLVEANMLINIIYYHTCEKTFVYCWSSLLIRADQLPAFSDNFA